MAQEPSDRRFDLRLFIQLNEEYRHRPIVSKPRDLDDTSRQQRAASRAEKCHKRVDLRCKRVIEVGCGEGDLSLVLARDYASDVLGVDVREYPAWRQAVHPNLELRVLDISREHGLARAGFERIVSLVVWEHVRHPFSALKACRELLAPDGVFYLRANLHRSAIASHRYREVFFPWSHLLFTDEVFEQYYRHIGMQEQRPAWVNALTYADYLRYFRLLGFEVQQTWLAQRSLDEGLYSRFEDVLGRYPRFDLTLDFFDVVLTPGQS